MTALKWRDKHEVAMLSTYHSNQMITIQSPCGQKLKPEVILAYSEKKGKSDLSEQQLMSYPCRRKCHKVWYKKFFR